MIVGCIGDIHGRPYWREFIKTPNVDLWIFLADYHDTHHHDMTAQQIISNFEEVIEFKKSDPKKSKLLLGNHDIPYFHLDELARHHNIPYSGDTDFEVGWSIYDIFKENKDLFKIAHQIGNHLFVHAGVAKKWYQKHEDTITEFSEKLGKKASLADIFNAIWKSDKKTILFEVGKVRGGRGVGGIVWADKTELQQGIIEGYNQYCGHNVVESIRTLKFPNASITFVDTQSSIPPSCLILDTETNKKEILTLS